MGGSVALRLGVPWEALLLALGILAWGFEPRIRRVVKSWQAPKITRTFQAFTDGDELLKQVEWIENRCEQLRNTMTPATDDVRKATIRELCHLSIELETLRGKYYGIWNDELKNRVTIVANQAREAGSAPSGNDFAGAKAFTEATIQTARGLAEYLKSPPSS